MSARSTSAAGGNEYGYFDEAAREYVITRPDTPTPWINYIGEGRYGGIVSNTGGGYSFDRDPRNRRVTRYRYNAIPADQPGRYVYLRDQDTGEYWSPTWQPVRRDLEGYECRHGTAYTTIRSAYRGIEAEIALLRPAELGRRARALRALGAPGPQHRHRAAAPAQLQLRRVQLLRRLQRHGQPRLGPAHRLQRRARTA